MINLGIDIDGTINDFNSLIYKYADKYNEGLGISKKTDMSEYSLGRFFGWSTEQDIEFWTQNLQNAMSKTTPLSKSACIISRLKEKGVGIYIITARPESYRESTCSWLNKHNIQYDKLIMSSDKVSECLIHEIDVMIEDHPDNCLAIAQHIQVLCMTYPYNLHLRDRNIKRVCCWTEIYEEVTKLQEEKQVV